MYITLLVWKQVDTETMFNTLVRCITLVSLDTGGHRTYYML
jgi:hypothetical protein